MFELCEEICDNPFDLHLHIDFTHSEIQDEHPCDICEQNFNRKDTLQCHIKNIHQCARKFQNNHNNKSRKCAVCGKGFQSKKLLAKHISTEHDVKKIYKHIEKQHKCNKCDFVCSRPKRLKEHIANIHDGVKLYQCHECGQGIN